MVGFEYTNIVVSDCKRVFDIDQKGIINTWMFKVVATGSDKKRDHFLVVEGTSFFKTLSTEVIKRLAKISCMSLVVISYTLVALLDSCHVRNDPLKVKRAIAQ